MTETIPARTDLAGLLARVKAATGPDSELDREIADALSQWQGGLYERYTASVDCCLALVERVLPGFGWAVVHHDEHFGGKLFHWAEVRELGRWPTVYRSRGATAPLAILAALLTALEQGAT